MDPNVEEATWDKLVWDSFWVPMVPPIVAAFSALAVESVAPGQHTANGVVGSIVPAGGSVAPIVAAFSVAAFLAAEYVASGQQTANGVESAVVSFVGRELICVNETVEQELAVFCIKGGELGRPSSVSFLLLGVDIMIGVGGVGDWIYEVVSYYVR